MNFLIKSGLMMAVAILTVTVNAVNVAENGSFEEKGECPKYDTLVKKGFTLNFKENEWAQKWYINPASKKAVITLITDKNAVDGKKYLEVRNSEGVHIYLNKDLPGDFSYDISFSAKAPTGKNKLAIFVYVQENKRFVASEIIKEKIELTDQWTEYSLKLPKYGSNKLTKVGFRINGSCDLDNVIIKMKE